MKKSGMAFFVKTPRRIEDLLKLHAIEEERAYEIIKYVRLAKIDYENFITDLVADRQFIENNADLCSKDGTWQCILVQQHGRRDGVLVIPENGCYIGWAAYFNE